MIFLQNKLDKFKNIKNQKYILYKLYILMKNNTGITNKIKHFINIFDKRSYKTFKIVVNWILCLKDWKQWDLANIWEITLWKIQYFFDKSSWNYEKLNNLRIQWIRNKIWWARDKKSDILIFDWTVFAKNKASKFWWITDYFFSNRDKKVVKWIELFWASIIAKNGLKYMLDIEIFTKIKDKLLLKNKWDSEINSAWRKFMTKTIKKTKSWLVVLDSGFKWAEMCKNIYENCKKHFLVRISATQVFFNENWEKFKISNLLKKKNAIYFEDWKMWVFKSVFLQSWNKKWFKKRVNIIVFHKNWLKNPSVLATSAEISDIYDNMIKKNWERSFKEKLEENKWKISIENQEKSVYFAFVELYKKRWTIEECFKKLKSYLSFEKFQVQSNNAIMKYLHIILLVHTLTYIMIFWLTQSHNNFIFVYNFLKEKRNIKNKSNWIKKITFMWLKLFIEMMFQLWWSWKIKWKSRKYLKNILKSPLCLNYNSCYKIGIK